MSKFTISDTSKKLEPTQILKFVKDYLRSDEFCRLETLEDYYGSENTEILRRYRSKAARNQKPNVCLPTSYYSTVTDSMAGYMFSNVQYTAETDEDKEYVDALNDILYANNVQISDMKSGITSLAYNKGIELVYTIGDGNKTEIKFSSLDPDEIVLIYDNSIENKLFCAIRISECNPDEYDLDVIYADLWQFFHSKGDKIEESKPAKNLLFSECPVVVYETSILTDDAPFECILPYIDAYDVLISGNNEEVSKLADAILVLGKKLKEEDVERLGELKVLMDMAQEERAEYIQRDASPVFREYLTKLLTQEMFRHSHVIDWYSPETGLSGAASGKALLIRLHDMSVYSSRLEQMYRQGAKKRIKLITELMALLDMPVGYVEIEYKRTLPNFIDELITALNGADYLTRETKVKLLGLDWSIEQERIKNEEVPEISTATSAGF